MSSARNHAMRIRDRLHFRIFCSLLAGLLLVAALSWGAWRWYATQFDDAAFKAYADIASHVVPAADAPAQLQQQTLDTWARRLKVLPSLYGPNGELLAYSGTPLPPPAPGRTQSGWIDIDTRLAALHLNDGRWLVVRTSGYIPKEPLRVVGLAAVMALVLSAFAYPVARRLTKRLERLQGSVEALGAGNLTARVDASGCDEVAHLARSFNLAAERIQALVASQRTLLANASHELRSPLARIRMAVELAEATTEPQLRDELRRNIVELDALIDEILLASRLEANAPALASEFEDVDLAAIVAEECARADARFSGANVSVRGDARLLRRLVRNLLDNARRHGGSAPIDVTLGSGGANIARLAVCDRGAGIPAELRERIFEPFFRAPGTREGDGGVGLGLALVRGIAERHGGQVRCEARVGGGSCFAVTLPAL